jgi:dsRNA-specific ribonuclease
MSPSIFWVIKFDRAKPLFLTFSINVFAEEQVQSYNSGRENDLLNKKDLEEIEADSNQNLTIVGNKLIQESLEGFIRKALPYIPEDGVKAIKCFLTTDEMLARISFHIGSKDLILSKEYPPSRETYADVFNAIVGALSLR